MDIGKLMPEIEAVDSIVKLAANLQPKNHKNTGLTRKETEDIIGKTVIMIQSKLLAYAALQAAVKESKDNEKIGERALAIYDIAIKRFGVEVPSDQ